MPRAKRYLDVDVLEAARSRIEHIFDTFDSVVVMFSGGKDSQVCLHLVKEFHDKWGLGPVNAIFSDREIYSPNVIKFLEGYREKEWLNLDWYCLPREVYRMSAGRKIGYVDWDPNREWLRPKPEWAITEEDIPNFSMKSNRDDMRVEKFPGKIAMVTGVRADESIIRFRSVTQKLNDNYINQIENNPRGRMRMCKPIYDWSQLDVFKYLYDNGIPWAEIYDWNELANTSLRVETPLHPEAIRNFGKIRETEPEYYQKIVDMFPDMMTQDRYGDDIDKNKVIEPYLQQGFNGVVRYIKENIHNEDLRQEAMLRAKQWKKRWQNDPDNYPIEDILKVVAFSSTNKRLAGRYINSKGYKKGKKDD